MNLKAFFLFALLLIVCGTLKSQDSIPLTIKDFYLIDRLYADSLIYEVKKGRKCEKTRIVYLEEMASLRDDIVNLEKSVKLLNSQKHMVYEFSKTWKAQVDELKNRIEIEKDKLKERIKKLWKVIYIQGGVITVIVVIIILI